MPSSPVCTLDVPGDHLRALRTIFLVYSYSSTYTTPSHIVQTWSCSSARLRASIAALSSSVPAPAPPQSKAFQGSTLAQPGCSGIPSVSCGGCIESVTSTSTKAGGASISSPRRLHLRLGEAGRCDDGVVNITHFGHGTLYWHAISHTKTHERTRYDTRYHSRYAGMIPGTAENLTSGTRWLKKKVLKYLKKSKAFKRTRL